MEENFISVHEVSEVLSISVKAVNALIKSGELAGYQFGREIRVKEEDLQQFIMRSKVQMNQQIIDKANDFKLKCLEMEVAGKAGSIEEAAEILEASDPSGYNALKHWEAHKHDKPGVVTGFVGGSAGSGSNYEQMVETVRQQRGCRESEAVRVVMSTPEGKQAFESYWQGIEQAARERAYTYER